MCRQYSLHYMVGAALCYGVQGSDTTMLNKEI